jgi:hypothetical protein
MHRGHLSFKPGWVRMSVHPTMTNEEVIFIIDAIEQVALRYSEWKEDYKYDEQTNEYEYSSFEDTSGDLVQKWFQL